ncbi:MAG: tetraacyldisaccharide 4'-kinase [Bacteroidia bacterium]|nr:tetraacyldisaccharide 4'-kinase [Bacteroidia bacterium]MDW8089546.1 tetraacyldisaccharide 4'-kinase [Bacteroidia bacterium]
MRESIEFILWFLRFLFTLPAGLLYGLFMQLRNWLYDRKWLPIYELPCLVISVGNLTLGGSGKTPFSLLLLAWLSQQGLKAAYLSRGYKRLSRGFAEVEPHAPQAGLRYGDEALLVKERFPECPVAVCEDRVLGGRKLLERYPDIRVLVLDDAFQHRRLHRHLDILLIDIESPIWRDWIFPIGRLREPLRGYRRAHLFVLNYKAGPPKKAPPSFTLAGPTLSVRYEAVGLKPAFPELPALELEVVQNRSVIAFCGIANPESFERLLRHVRLYVVKIFAFPDHYIYKPADMRNIRKLFHKVQHQLRSPNILLLTTEKDLMRLRNTEALAELKGLPLYALQIEMQPLSPESMEKILSQFIKLS